MRSIWITLFAFIIAVTSTVVDLRGNVSFDFDTDQVSSSAQIKDAWQSDSIVSTQERYTKNSHLIAQEFIPIVIIAENSDLNDHFAYYLPLYNLSRQKEYFLLI